MAHRSNEPAYGVPGLEFYDAASKRKMKYVYPDTDHWTAGWVLYRHPNGQWVTLRKATPEDIKALNGAVVDAHHASR